MKIRTKTTWCGIISSVLIVVLLSSILSLSVFAQSESTESVTCWDGITQKEPSKLVKIDNIYYYEISTPEELAFVAQADGNWRTYNYRLTADIVLNSCDITSDEVGELCNNPADLNEWIPIQDFTSTFDGNGFTVFGLYAQDGLFGSIKGNIYNLSVKNAYVTGDGAGGICSVMLQGEMDNCTFSGTVKGDYVGGLVSWGGRITNCQNYGTIFSTFTDVSTSQGVGGIASNASSIENCQNFGDIYAAGDIVGGIVGRSWGGALSNVVNYGNVFGKNDVGGLCGRDCGTISNSMNYGSVVGENNVGGLCGRSSIGYGTQVANSNNRGKVTGTTYVGGLLGHFESTSTSLSFNSSFNAGEVEGNEYVGGLFGFFSGGITQDCNNYADVTGNSKVGALIGYTESIWGRGNIKNCYYLKDAETNTDLTAFGNAPDEFGIAEGKPQSFFPYFGGGKGELDGDGTITAVDARWALQAAANMRVLTEEQQAVADVNGDGNIDAVDARWILQTAAGIREL